MEKSANLKIYVTRKKQIIMEYFNFFRYNKKKIEKGENILADYHIHCKYSDDSEEKPEKIIKI